MKSFLAVLALVASVASSMVVADYNPSWAMDAVFANRVSNCQANMTEVWNCGPSCDYFDQNGMNMSDVVVFTNVTMDTRAWIGFDSTENRVWLTIRGSRNFMNWVEDFEFWQVEYPYCQEAGIAGGCKVHYGFFDVVKGLDTLGMTSQFIALIKKYPTAAVIVNGHSLGAAAATLAMSELLHLEATSENGSMNLKNRTVELYTFGSPRVGNQPFVSYLGNRLPNLRQHRLTHHEDPIPHLPPRWIDDYLHIPQEVYLPKNASSPFKLCNGNFTAEDPYCADSQLPIDPYDHIWYLGQCMGCCDNVPPYDNCCKKLPLKGQKDYYL